MIYTNLQHVVDIAIDILLSHLPPSSLKVSFALHTSDSREFLEDQVEEGNLQSSFCKTGFGYSICHTSKHSSGLCVPCKTFATALTLS